MNTLRRIIRNELDISESDYFSLFSTAILERDNKSLLAALLAALAAKPLNLNDTINFVKFIEQQTPKRHLSVSGHAVNIVGTGGGLSTFNISTTATFVAAASGATVMKSGSYSYNSQCGSLDLLSHMGFNINQDEHGLEQMLEELGIGFVSPKMYSPVLRRIAISALPLTLRDLGGFINTIGPLLCPFHVSGQICGVRNFDFIDIFAQAFASLGRGNSIVAWSEIGLDEFSAIGKNHFAQINNGVTREEINPESYGMHHVDLNQLAGGPPATNAAIMESVLKDPTPSAAKDTVVLNAAFLLLLARTHSSLSDAIEHAQATLASGAAYRLLHQAIEFSHDCASREIA